MAEEKTPAEKKRQKISKAQQITMLEVLAASLVLGTCMVISIFLIKYIKFNTKIISEKSEAITEYDQSLQNIGVWRDTDNNKRLSDKELDNCDPNALSYEQVPNTLRYNAMVEMAENKDLESVARQRSENCFDEEGNKIDFNKLYSEATDSLEKERYLQTAKICSALRVIPDALPAKKNTEALMASLNQLLILSGKEMDSLAPSDEMTESPIVGLLTIPVRLKTAGSDREIVNILDYLERSIRDVDILSATIEWTEGGLDMSLSANAYYLEDAGDLETTKTVSAKSYNANTNKKSGGNE